MSYGIESHQASGTVDTAGSDYFYYENGYYHRIRVSEVRERIETPVLAAA